MIKQQIADFIACHNTQTMHVNTVALAINVYCLCWNCLNTVKLRTFIWIAYPEAAICPPWPSDINMLHTGL